MRSLDTALTAIKVFAPDYLLISLGIFAITTDDFARMGTAIGAVGLPSLIVQEGSDLCDAMADNPLAFLGSFPGRI